MNETKAIFRATTTTKKNRGVRKLLSGCVNVMHARVHGGTPQTIFGLKC